MCRFYSLFYSFLFLIHLNCLVGEEVNKEERVSSEKTYHFYCTVADERHFPQLMNLIGSIHKNDFDHLDEIAVFDIGLSKEQLDYITTIEKVKVIPIEKKHPDITKYFATDPNGRSVRGWYAWKPVLFKQGLDLYPYFIYLDAGSLVLTSPDDLFQHLKQNGYFLIQISPHYIEERVTKPVIEKVVNKLPKEQGEFLLTKDAYMIDAGFQGISRKVLETYVLPMYNNVVDLELFADNGSSRMGFGAGRHDQTLFSIYAHANKMAMNGQGWSNLKIDGKSVPFHMHWDRNELNPQTCIYRSRCDYNYQGSKIGFIHWKKPLEGQN